MDRDRAIEECNKPEPGKRSVEFIALFFPLICGISRMIYVVKHSPKVNWFIMEFLNRTQNEPKSQFKLR